MGLNDTPSGERIHIGIFGRRNAGKSSLINVLTGQELAIVSEQRGTTTDPVYKAMELLPLGPVVMIDTPGFDDEGELGEKRVEKTRQVIRKADIALLVVDAALGISRDDEAIIRELRCREIPTVTVLNKCDLGCTTMPDGAIAVSAATGNGIRELKERLGALARRDGKERRLVGDLIKEGGTAVLVVPIDSAAPKGRLILPQQQVIRDLLERGALTLTVRETELAAALRSLKSPPAMVITDSQAFSYVAKITPREIPLTSFSILMARYKGFLDAAMRGVGAVESLSDGDTVLISEGCTHHRQCEDIGTVKIPKWLREYSKKDINIVTSSGADFPDDIKKYAMVIHCGGCMLNERELRYRMRRAEEEGVPFTNYGTLIAYLNGILRRSVEIFPHLSALLEKGKSHE